MCNFDNFNIDNLVFEICGNKKRNLVIENDAINDDCFLVLFLEFLVNDIDIGALININIIFDWKYILNIYWIYIEYIII